MSPPSSPAAVKARAAGIHPGQPWPLGASLSARGVNFSVVAPLASRVELLLFAHGEAIEPEQVVELGSAHRSSDHWHVEVEGIGLGTCYGYRVYGPLQPGNHSFNPSKVLLDPCARAIAGWQGYRRGAPLGAAPNTPGNAASSTNCTWPDSPRGRAARCRRNARAACWA